MEATPSWSPGETAAFSPVSGFPRGYGPISETMPRVSTPAAPCRSLVRGICLFAGTGGANPPYRFARPRPEGCCIVPPPPQRGDRTHDYSQPFALFHPPVVGSRPRRPARRSSLASPPSRRTAEPARARNGGARVHRCFRTAEPVTAMSPTPLQQDAWTSRLLPFAGTPRPHDVKTCGSTSWLVRGCQT